MSDSRPSSRDIRKRLLLLEAEAYRLEMRSSMQRLRNPLEHLSGAPAMLGLLGGAGGGLSAVAALFGAGRLGWIVKALPLALAGWRIAHQFRSMLARRRKH